VFGWNVTIDSRLPQVQTKVKNQSFKNLGHASGYLTKAARNSIRRRKKPSAPGTPPHTPTGKLKRLFRYAVNRARQSSVIGPIPGIPSAGTVWNLHEHGGIGRKKFKPIANRRYKIGDWIPIRLSGSSGKVAWIKAKTPKQLAKAQANAPIANALRENESRVERHYPKRPFMRPTLEKNRSKLPTFWRDTVR
jgi:hypothetical protein